jgi:hypothetical protein
LCRLEHVPSVSRDVGLSVIRTALASCIGHRFPSFAQYFSSLLRELAPRAPALRPGEESLMPCLGDHVPDPLGVVVPAQLFRDLLGDSTAFGPHLLAVEIGDAGVADVATVSTCTRTPSMRPCELVGREAVLLGVEEGDRRDRCVVGGKRRLPGKL